MFIEWLYTVAACIFCFCVSWAGLWLDNIVFSDPVIYSFAVITTAILAIGILVVRTVWLLEEWWKNRPRKPRRLKRGGAYSWLKMTLRQRHRAREVFHGV